MTSINTFNKVEKSWTTSSGHNAICFANGHGYRCGYVEITKEEIQSLQSIVLYPMDYYSYPINCHGDLTYCGRSFWDKDNVNIWIGFDCYHYGDLKDPSICDYNLNYNNFGTIKDQDFVINECEKIGMQLNDLKNKIKFNKF